MGMSHPLPASASRDQSPTWGSWGPSVTFLSLLSWELMETCGQQQRCHLRAAARSNGGEFPPALLCRGSPNCPERAGRGTPPYQGMLDGWSR